MCYLYRKTGHDVVVELEIGHNVAVASRRRRRLRGLVFGTPEPSSLNRGNSGPDFLVVVLVKQELGLWKCQGNVAPQKETFPVACKLSPRSNDRSAKPPLAL